MRKLLGFILISFLLSSTFSFAAEYNVAIFDIQKVAKESNAAKDAQIAIAKWYKPEEEKLKKEKLNLEKISSKRATKTPTKSENEDFLNRQKKYMKDVQELLTKADSANQTIRIKFDDLLEKAAAQYAKKTSYTLILDSNTILYKDSSLQFTDVTSDMVKEINAVWEAEKK